MKKLVLILSALILAAGFSFAQCTSYDCGDYDEAMYEAEDEIYDSYEVRIKRFHRPRIRTAVYFDGVFAAAASAAIITAVTRPEFYYTYSYNPYYRPYRPYYRPYSYRPYYRPYSYHPHYRPYSYRPYSYRPYYRPYAHRPDYHAVRPPVHHNYNYNNNHNYNHNSNHNYNYNNNYNHNSNRNYNNNNNNNNRNYNHSNGRQQWRR